MRVWGLRPVEYSSGERRPQGASTTAGNPQARRALVAGAWAYRSPAKVRRPVPRRLATQPKMSQDLSGQAHGRRCKRYRHLGARGKQAPIVTVALARELAGGLGAMAKQRLAAAYA